MTSGNKILNIIFVFALFLCSILGCLPVATQNIVRVDGGITEVYEISESGLGSIQKWILPERRAINRIEIYFDPIEPLKNMTVYARMGEDKWRIVKAFKTPIRKSPHIIRTPLVTDGIRIVLSSSMGSIDQIRLYGSAPETASESPF